LPFEQGNQPRTGTTKGSGIGLSVALECALIHGGSLQLGTHPQAEICFQLILPLQRIPSADDDKITSHDSIDKVNANELSTYPVSADINNVHSVSQPTRMEGL